MTSIPVGDLTFSRIIFNDSEVGKALERFVITGSSPESLSVTDLKIVSRSSTPPDVFNSLIEAIQNGTRLFDALGYFSIAPEDRPKPSYEPADPNNPDPTPDAVASALYYVYCFLMFRGTPPPHIKVDKNFVIPNFLPGVANLKEEPYIYVRRVASFDLARMEHRWIKYIPIPKLNQTARNRLSLGVAGYREPSALLYAMLQKDTDPLVVRATEAVRKFIQRGATWDVQSVTRTNKFLSVVKNFNKNCANLLALGCTTEELEKLRRNKIIFALPIYDDRYTNWRNWTDETFQPFDDFIVSDASE